MRLPIRDDRNLDAEPTGRSLAIHLNSPRASLFEKAMQTFHVVATLQAYPEQRIGRGQVGTVVETLDNDHLLVEFADLNGVTYALTPIPAYALIALRHAPAGRPAGPTRADIAHPSSQTD